MRNKGKLKDTLLLLLFLALFAGALFLAGRNIVTFLFGKTVELSPKRISYSASEESGCVIDGSFCPEPIGVCCP